MAIESIRIKNKFLSLFLFYHVDFENFHLVSQNNFQTKVIKYSFDIFIFTLAYNLF